MTRSRDHGPVRRQKPRRGPAPKVVDLRTRSLIKRAVDGDEAAFACLYRDHHSLVTGVLRKLMSGSPDVEDAVQVTFVEVYSCLARYEGRAKFSTWVAGVAINVGKRMLRRRRLGLADAHDWASLPATAPGPDAIAEGREVARRAEAVLLTLSPLRRATLVDVDLCGASHHRVSDDAGVGVATVRTRLFYARREFWAKAAADPVLSAIAG